MESNNSFRDKKANYKIIFIKSSCSYIKIISKVLMYL